MVPRFLGLLLLPALLCAQSGMRDRYFARYPFEKWQADGPAAAMKWAVRVQPAKLSPHQRLAARFEIELDSREVDKRRGRGEMIVFIEVADAEGRKYRTHEAYDLRRVPSDAKALPLEYAQDVFVQPGDYRISFAMCDSRTTDHNFQSRTLHVPPIHADPLPDAGRELPAVEFLRLYQPPEVWYQPYTRGRLKIRAEAPKPIHIDLVMNMTPSQRFSGSVRVFRRNMSVLLPALKILSGMEVADGSLDVTLLDLTQRRTWSQPGARGLDWNRMREPFANANPGVVDLQSLQAKGEMQQFFWDQILDRLRAPREAVPLRAVIVLSAPVFLERQYKVEPATFPKDPNRRVYYVRYRPPAPTRPPVPTFGPQPGGSVPASVALPSDDLEHTLKLLDARTFNIQSADEFRKALAAILSDIARM